MISAATPAVPSAFITKAENVALDVWNVTSWPVSDFAADVGWSVGWLTMALFTLKVVAVGLHAENKARPFFSRGR